MKSVFAIAVFVAAAATAGSVWAQVSGLPRPAGPNCPLLNTVIAVVQHSSTVTYDCAAARQDVSRTVTGTPIRRILVRVGKADAEGCTLYVKGAAGREQRVARIQGGARVSSLFGLDRKVMSYRLDC